MNNAQKYKAILMKKIELNEDKYLFKPIKTVIGEYDVETGIFSTDDEIYLNITEKSLYRSDEEYGVINIIPANQKLPENIDKLFYYIDNSADNLILSIPYDIEGTANEYKSEFIKKCTVIQIINKY